MKPPPPRGISVGGEGRISLTVRPSANLAEGSMSGGGGDEAKPVCWLDRACPSVRSSTIGDMTNGPK
jgi:hypothetical protein